MLQTNAMKIKRLDEKCTKCMLCTKDCISTVWKDIDGVPEVVAPEDCNLCSHCLAVCPHDAIEHEGLDINQIKRINTGFVDPEAFETIVRGRRSIRQYKNKRIPEELIKKVINCASQTPTATNSQHVEYIVVSDKKIMNSIAGIIFNFAVKIYKFTKKFPGNLIYNFIKLFPSSEIITRYLEPMPYYIDETQKGRDFILHNAPVLILVHAPKGGNFANENCNLAASNIINHAYSLGLGTCYIGFLNLSLKFSKKIRALIQLPKNRMVYASIIMGYPAYKHSNTASRKTPSITWFQ